MMKHFLKYAFPGLLLLTVIAACEKEYETIEVIDDRNITTYIQQNKLNVQEYQGTGIYYEVVSSGTGTEVEYSEQLPLIFTRRSLDGQYVSSDTFSVENRSYSYLGYMNPEAVRIGIKEVLKKRSGTLRMIIPSRLAFGRNGVGNIPGNASLDLTVKVLDKSKLADYEDFTIKKYMDGNGLTGFTKTSTGLYYKIAEVGTGSSITIDSTVSAEYTGKFLNGAVFDKAVAGSAASFALNGINKDGINAPIKGWQQAIPLIKQGGSIRIIIPSALAYGLEGNSGIVPAFSCLDFDVKITDVTQ